MCRHLLFLLLVALCALQSVAPKRHQKEVEKTEAEDAKVMVDAVGDHEDEVDDDDIDDRDLGEEEEEEDEAFTGDLPFHPVNDVTDPALQDLIVRSRRPSCSYRKCTRFYRGWFSEQCTAPDSRAIAYCRRTQKWCCATCKAKDWCTANGGYCAMRDQCLSDGGLPKKNGCFGKWWCCLPAL